MLPQQPCSRSGTWYAVDPAGYGDARTYLIKAVRSCYPTIAQVHERLPIAKCQHILLPGCRYGSEEGYRPSLAPSLFGLVAFPARHARVARCGVRQPCCRSSRAHDPVRGTSLTLLVTGMLWMLVTFIESVGNE